MTKAERRETKRNKRKYGMKVSGQSSIQTIQQEKVKRGRKASK